MFLCPGVSIYGSCMFVAIVISGCVYSWFRSFADDRMALSGPTGMCLLHVYGLLPSLAFCHLDFFKYLLGYINVLVTCIELFDHWLSVSCSVSHWEIFVLVVCYRCLFAFFQLLLRRG